MEGEGWGGGGHVFFAWFAVGVIIFRFLLGESSKRFAVVSNKCCQFPLAPRQ